MRWCLLLGPGRALVFDENVAAFPAGGAVGCHRPIGVFSGRISTQWHRWLERRWRHGQRGHDGRRRHGRRWRRWRGKVASVAQAAQAVGGSAVSRGGGVRRILAGGRGRHVRRVRRRGRWRIGHDRCRGRVGHDRRRRRGPGRHRWRRGRERRRGAAMWVAAGAAAAAAAPPAEPAGYRPRPVWRRSTTAGAARTSTRLEVQSRRRHRRAGDRRSTMRPGRAWICRTTGASSSPSTRTRRADSNNGYLDGGIGWYRKSFTRRPGVERPADPDPVRRRLHEQRGLDQRHVAGDAPVRLHELRIRPRRPT